MTLVCVEEMIDRINKRALILVVVHWILFAVALWLRDDPFQIDNIHFHYEPVLVKLLTLLDFPALIAAALVGTILPSTSLGNSLTWVIAALTVSVQWYAVGYLIFRLREARNTGSRGELR